METMQNLTNLKTPNAGLSTDTALAAATRGCWRSQKPWLPGHTHHAGAKCCTTCATRGRSCGGHEAPYCAHPGGAMEKQGFDAAQDAARAAGLSTTGQTPKGKGASSRGKTYTQLTGPQGKVYLIEEGSLKKLQTLSTTLAPASFAGLATDKLPADMTTVDEAEWKGWMVVIEEEELKAS
ncbi:hypothetical protein C0992_013102, partial [Termitomyces sp. T32_za158]